MKEFLVKRGCLIFSIPNNSYLLRLLSFSLSPTTPKSGDIKNGAQKGKKHSLLICWFLVGNASFILFYAELISCSFNFLATRNCLHCLIRMSCFSVIVDTTTAGPNGYWCWFCCSCCPLSLLFYHVISKDASWQWFPGKVHKFLWKYNGPIVQHWRLCQHDFTSQLKKKKKDQKVENEKWGLAVLNLILTIGGKKSLRRKKW